MLDTQEFPQHSRVTILRTSNGFLLLLPLLILVTPFLVFLNHHSYGVFHWEVFIGIGCMAGVALLCSVGLVFGGFVVRNFILFSLLVFFINIQYRSLGEITIGGILLILGVLLMVLKEKFLPIATAVFSMFFLVTLIQFGFAQDTQGLALSASASSVENTAPPRIIHLVLDEHIGLEGIPVEVQGGKELQAQLRKFYQQNGFLTFGGAYSHYLYTEDSISNLLNFSSVAQHRQYFIKEDGPNTLFDNKYFEILSQAGYGLNVVWGHHIDYCSRSPVAIAHCIQIPPRGLKLTQDIPLKISERVQLIFSAYLSRSTIYGMTKNIYLLCRDQLLAYGIELPSISWDRHKVTTLPYLDALDALWDNIVELPAHNALFAHLLIPHAPYLANADCSIPTSLSEWKYNSLLFSRDSLHGPWSPNTERSRKEHYQRYFKQVQCLYTWLEDLFERMQVAGIWENSVIIIHGDHGSRIMREELSIQNEAQLSKADMLDGYSTLFAVKLPGKQSVYHSKPLPLEYLLHANVVNLFSKNQKPVLLSSPFVYLESEDPMDLNLKKVSYPTIQ